MAESKIIMDNHIKNPPKKYDGRIALFGTRASGKTVFIATLYNQYRNNAKGLAVHFVDNVAGEYLLKLTNYLIDFDDIDNTSGQGGMTRSWPPASVIENELGLLLDLESDRGLGKTQLKVQLYDPPGGYLTLATNTGYQNYQEAAKRMKDFIVEADGVLMFFEPDNFSFAGLRTKISDTLNDILPWYRNSQQRYAEYIKQLLDFGKQLSEMELLQLLQKVSILPFVDIGHKDNLRDELLQEIKLLREKINEQPESRDLCTDMLTALLQDEELKYWLRKYEINIEPLIANPFGANMLTTPTGRQVNVLGVFIEALKTGTNGDQQTIVDAIIRSYKSESNAKLMAATERLQEIITESQTQSATHRSVAVLIAKADELEVFRQSVRKPFILIPPELENLKFKIGENRLPVLRDALKQYWGKIDSRWEKVISELFDGPLKDLFLRLMSFNGDFQIFFLSAVGTVERDRFGFPIPPRKLRPEGVDAPIVWIAKQIYTRSMVQRAIRNMLHWILVPISLFVIPLTLWIFTWLLNSADTLKSSEQISRYEFISNLLVPLFAEQEAKNAVYSLQIHNIQNNYAHWLQGKYTTNDLNSNNVTKDDTWKANCALGEKAETSSLKDNIEALVKQMPIDLSAAPIAKNLSQTVAIGCIYVDMQKRYLDLKKRLNNLTGKQDEVSILLNTIDGFLSLLVKELSSFTPNIDIGTDANSRLKILNAIKQHVTDTKNKINGFITKGVPMKFVSTSDLINLHVGNATSALTNGNEFLWKPKYTEQEPKYTEQEPTRLRFVPKLGSDVKVPEAAFYEPVIFKRGLGDTSDASIQIIMNDERMKVYFTDTWNSYEDAFKELLPFFDDIVASALGNSK